MPEEAAFFHFYSAFSFIPRKISGLAISKERKFSTPEQRLKWLLEHQIAASARTGLTSCRVPSQICDQRRLRPSHRPLQNRKIHVDSAALTHQPCLDLRCRLAVSGVREVALLFRRWRARDVRRTNLQALRRPGPDLRSPRPASWLPYVFTSPDEAAEAGVRVVNALEAKC
jgi:hypothetical protein